MKSILTMLATIIFITGCATAGEKEIKDIEWKPGINIDQLWQDYANANGGITWGTSTEYPEYSKVKEGDTFLVQVEQGTCLMEFFHERWRRANDVRRWDDSVNEHSGCPYVFD